jgi:hypothetical protein
MCKMWTDLIRKSRDRLDQLAGSMMLSLCDI